MALIDSFSAYTRWRGDLVTAVQRLKTWLSNNDIGDAQIDLRLQCVLDRLREDKLVVAFVAEFSRGKSELINAIFFSQYGNRVLPSSAGRTTMCPTELQWEPGQMPGVRLLPIETRNRRESVSDLRQKADEWVFEAFDLENAQSLQRAFSRVGETRLVSRQEAEELGFTIDDDGVEGVRPTADGQVEIARWRHAIVQFPHPLLEQGLVIIDTPGLNAIGSEPELTLSLLPSAHAVLFILAADTGVTQSDLQVWQKHVNAGRMQRHGRVVVLNKIDGLWDGLRAEKEIDAEVDRQVRSVAKTLELDADMVFPVSAQKALFAKVSQDEALLERSRIGRLESALSSELVPTRQQIIRDNTVQECGEIIFRANELLNTRLIGLREQLKEMADLRGKNQSVIEYMMRKVRAEKDEFDRGLLKYHAVRSVFTNLSNKVFSHIGMDAVRQETRRTRSSMDKATFSSDLRSAMKDFFETLRGKLRHSAQDIEEITNMLDVMYKRFSVEHGLKLAPPNGFSTQRYERDIVRLERAFNEEIATLTALMTHSKGSLTQRFFETVALEARKTFEIANRDVEQWLRVVMAPLDTQVREYQLQLRRRLESVKRVHEATGTLEERIKELLQAEDVLLHQVTELDELRKAAETVLGVSASLPAAENNLAA